MVGLPAWERVTDPIELGRVRQEALAYFQERVREAEHFSGGELMAGMPSDMKADMLQKFRANLAKKALLFRMKDVPVYKLPDAADPAIALETMARHPEFNRAVKNDEVFEVWPSPPAMRPGGTIYAFGSVFERMFGSGPAATPPRA